MSADLSKKQSLIYDDLAYWVTSPYTFSFDKNNLHKVTPNKKNLKVIDNNSQLFKKNKELYLSFYQTIFNSILENKIIP